MEEIELNKSAGVIATHLQCLNIYSICMTIPPESLEQILKEEASSDNGGLSHLYKLIIEIQNINTSPNAQE